MTIEENQAGFQSGVTPVVFKGQRQVFHSD